VLVTGRIRAWLADPVALLNAVQCCRLDGVGQKKLLDEAGRHAASWQELDVGRLRAILRATVTRVQVHSDRVDVTLDLLGLARGLNGKDQQPSAHPDEEDREEYLTVSTIPARLKRTGIEMRLVVEDGSEPANVDPVLVRLLLGASSHVSFWTPADITRCKPQITYARLAASPGATFCHDIFYCDRQAEREMALFLLAPKVALPN
jgi:hypothetical protein